MRIIYFNVVDFIKKNLINLLVKCQQTDLVNSHWLTKLTINELITQKFNQHKGEMVCGWVEFEYLVRQGLGYYKYSYRKRRKQWEDVVIVIIEAILEFFLKFLNLEKSLEVFKRIEKYF